MKKIRFGVICPSEIAYRRFMPSIARCDDAEYVGIASANADEWFGKEERIIPEILEKEREKALSFKEVYGGKVFDSYEKLLTASEIDAVYLPLPPALHFRFAKQALENGKHILLEKPSTTSAVHTRALLSLAEKKNLAVHENYMFIYHSQLDEINKIVKSGMIGDVRLYRIAFGFPRRAQNDFRYKKALGGGALLDCGGYTLKLASALLGPSAKIVFSHLNYTEEFEVDLYGSATLQNENGLTAQLSFGMDNSYRCELEIWGSKGSLFTDRIFTAPDGFVPHMTLTVGNAKETKPLPADNSFLKSIGKFCKCVQDGEERRENHRAILRQAEYVDIFKGESPYGTIENY